MEAYTFNKTMEAYTLESRTPIYDERGKVTYWFFSNENIENPKSDIILIDNNKIHHNNKIYEIINHWGGWCLVTRSTPDE